MMMKTVTKAQKVKISAQYIAPTLPKCSRMHISVAAQCIFWVLVGSYV